MKDAGSLFPYFLMKTNSEYPGGMAHSVNFNSSSSGVSVVCVCLFTIAAAMVIYRGSYMSAHVLLNLLNELGKIYKMRGLPSILSLFRNEFNKFNNTRARMLDSIYHMTNTLKSDFWRKNVIILSLCTQRCYGRHYVSRKSINH